MGYLYMVSVKLWRISYKEAEEKFIFQLREIIRIIVSLISLRGVQLTQTAFKYSEILAIHTTPCKTRTICLY